MSLVLKLETEPISHIEQCAKQAVEIADKLNVKVEFKLDDITCITVPGSSVKDLVNNFMTEISPPPVKSGVVYSLNNNKD